MNVKRIIEPAVVLIDHAQAIAAGDLNRELTGSLGNLSQLGSRFNDMVNQISQTVNEISNIADSVKNTARRTIDTADRAMETWDEIAGRNKLTGVRGLRPWVGDRRPEIAGIAEAIQGWPEKRLMHHEMQKTVGIAQEGLSNAVLQKSKARENSLSVGRVSEVVARLQDDSDRISEVVRVISDIASQTSLLAFNAAIESSRAGLSGRAFGVLAEETRVLSQEAAGATQEIGGTVPRVQDIIERVVSKMQQVQTDLENQVRIIGESEEVLARIESQAQRIRDQSLQIMNTVRSLVELRESVVMDAGKVAAYREETVAGAEEVFTVIEDQTQTYHMIKEIAEQFLSNSEQLRCQITSGGPAAVYPALLMWTGGKRRAAAHDRGRPPLLVSVVWLSKRLPGGTRNRRLKGFMTINDLWINRKPSCCCNNHRGAAGSHQTFDNARFPFPAAILRFR